MDQLANVVLIPASVDEAPAALEFLRKLRAGEGDVASLVAASALVLASDEYVDVRGQRRWYRHEVDQLKGALPYPALQVLLSRVVKAKGGWVAKHEAEDPADPHSRIQLRNELGALTKRCSRLFDSSAWPMEWKKERGVYYYRMEPQMAEWWGA